MGVKPVCLLSIALIANQPELHFLVFSNLMSISKAIIHCLFNLHFSHSCYLHSFFVRELPWLTSWRNRCEVLPIWTTSMIGFRCCAHRHFNNNSLKNNHLKVRQSQSRSLLKFFLCKFIYGFIHRLYDLNWTQLQCSRFSSSHQFGWLFLRLRKFVWLFSTCLVVFAPSIKSTKTKSRLMTAIFY